jgi:MraZ protein
VEKWKKVWKTSTSLSAGHFGLPLALADVFKGTHHYRIDAKGRLPVPAPFRRALEERGDTGVVATLLDQCLALYPSAEWLRLERQLEQLPAFNRAAKALSRLLVSRAADCDLDTQGRILLPPPLRQGAGLEREAVVIGVLNRFEVWRPDRWEGFLAESERLLDDAALDVAWPPPAAPPATLPQRKPRR